MTKFIFYKLTTKWLNVNNHRWNRWIGMADERKPWKGSIFIY